MPTSIRLDTTLYGTDYATLASAPDASAGILYSGWFKDIHTVGAYPLVIHNQYVALRGTNWYIETVPGSETTSAAVARFGSNFMISGTAGASSDIWAADYAVWDDTTINETKALGWVWCAWQVFVNGSADIVMRQWVRYYGTDTLNYTTSTVSIATLRTLLNTNSGTSDFNAWTPGAATDFSFGNGISTVAFDLTRVRIESYASMPSDAKLLAISNNTAADTTAWADYAFEWVSGAAVLTDRSGNGRNLTNAGTLYAGQTTYDTPALYTFKRSVGTTVTGTGTSLSLTVGAAGCAYDALVAVGFHSNTAALASSVTDSQGNIYTLAKGQTGTTSDGEIWLSRLTTALVSGNTITVNFGGSRTASLAALEFAGQTEQTVHVTNSGAAAGTDVTPTASITTTVNAALVIGLRTNSASATEDATPTNYTVGATRLSAVPSLDLLYSITTTAGARALSGQWSATGNLIGVNISVLPAVAPIITAQPASISARAGDTATFYVTATQGTRTYQWQRNDGAGFADISGATSTSYTTGVLSVAADSGDTYRCNVTNAVGTTASNAATLLVFPITYASEGMFDAELHSTGWFGPDWVDSALFDKDWIEVSYGGASPQTIAVAQATETNLAQSIAVVLGALIISVGQVSETDAAQTITPSQASNVAVVQVVETNLAQTISLVLAPRVITVGQVTETDLAQVITVRSSNSVSLGQVAETDLAQTITVTLAPRIVGVGQVTETDLSQAITAQQGSIIAVVQVTETDLSQTVTPSLGALIIAVGQATETDLSQAIAASQGNTIIVGQVTETDSLQDITPLIGCPSAGSAITLVLRRR